MVDPRMENYNYWRDSRVQAAMFSSCWEVVHQESESAIISFKESWVIDVLQEERLGAIARKWIEDEEDFTQEYRELRGASQAKKKIWEDEKAMLVNAYQYYWKAPKEDQDRVNGLWSEWNDGVAKDLVKAFTKLYERAEQENDIDKLAEEMGFEAFCNHDEEFRFCMRVRTKFEVCGQCRGSGKVVNPSIDCGGLTQEDFYDDPDFEEAYMSGRYDQTCPNCGGKRVEAIPQFPEWLNKAIADHDESEWEGIRESCQERAMGA